MRNIEIGDEVVFSVENKRVQAVVIEVHVNNIHVVDDGGNFYNVNYNEIHQVLEY